MGRDQNLRELSMNMISHSTICRDRDTPLWTKPWQNFFEIFEIMVSNDSMNPETLFEHD